MLRKEASYKRSCRFHSYEMSRMGKAMLTESRLVGAYSSDEEVGSIRRES